MGVVPVRVRGLRLDNTEPVLTWQCSAQASAGGVSTETSRSARMYYAEPQVYGIAIMNGLAGSCCLLYSMLEQFGSPLNR